MFQRTFPAGKRSPESRSDTEPFLSLDRIGEIWLSPSTPRSVPFGTTRFNSLHVLSDSGQSWMGIQVCPLLLFWWVQSSAYSPLTMFPSGSSPIHAPSILVDVVSGVFYISSALSSIVSNTLHGFCGEAIRPWSPSGFSYPPADNSLSTLSYISWVFLLSPGCSTCSPLLSILWDGSSSSWLT